MSEEQPFESWSGHLDNLIDALSDRYFTGQANFFRDDDDADPLILVVVTGKDQEDMERRFQRFMKPKITGEDV